MNIPRRSNVWLKKEALARASVFSFPARRFISVPPPKRFFLSESTKLVVMGSVPVVMGSMLRSYSILLGYKLEGPGIYYNLNYC